MARARRQILPLFTGDALTAEQYRTMVEGSQPEADIQASIRNELRRRGWLTIRINSGGMMNERGRFVAFYDNDYTGSKGLPDLIAVRGNGSGSFEGLFIEVKTKNGKLRESQRRFIAVAAAMGITVHVVRSWQDITTVLDTVEGETL